MTTDETMIPYNRWCLLSGRTSEPIRSFDSLRSWTSTHRLYHGDSNQPCKEFSYSCAFCRDGKGIDLPNLIVCHDLANIILEFNLEFIVRVVDSFILCQ